MPKSKTVEVPQAEPIDIQPMTKEEMAEQVRLGNIYSDVYEDTFGEAVPKKEN